MARSKRPKAGKEEEEGIKPVATPEREEVSRRRFLRQSAEVAAMSLFGVAALDPVIDRVLRRIAELRGTDRLAADVARRLPSGAAWASKLREKPRLAFRALDDSGSCY